MPKHHYNDGLIKRESNQKDINYRTALADRSSLCRDKNCQLSTINCQLSIVNCQQSTINYQLSTIYESTLSCSLVHP